MPTQKLTKSMCDRAVYKGKGEKGFFAVWDSELKGFGLRVSKGGSKQFIISYRLHGRKRFFTLGAFGILTVEQARKRAIAKLAQVLDGHDPALEKLSHSQGATVKVLCFDYLEKHAKQHKRSWKTDESRINNVIIPSIGNRIILSITRRDVANIHERIGKEKPYEANRVLALLSVIFEFARDMGYVQSTFENPARGIKKFEEQKRDRWVKPEELPQLAKAIDQEPNVYVKAALWLYLLTGLRKNELLKTRWDEIDFTRCELRLGADRTKAKRTHYVPLSTSAIEILRNIPRQEGNPFVFPGKNHGAHLVNIDKNWRRVRKNADLEDVHLHDLRRSVGSWMASSGHSLHLIGKALNHSNASTTQVYAHLSEDPLRKAFEEHGEKIVEFSKIREQDEEEKTG